MNGVCTIPLTAKENKEAGVICFDLRIPWKIPNNYYATVPSKFDGSNVRHTVTDSWSLYRIHVNWYWHIYALLASLAYFCNSFACSSKPWTCFCSVAKFYVSMSAVINHVSVSQTKTKVQSIWFPSRKLMWSFDTAISGPCIMLLFVFENWLCYANFVVENSDDAPWSLCNGNLLKLLVSKIHVCKELVYDWVKPYHQSIVCRI